MRRKDYRVALTAFLAPALLRNILKRLKPASMIGQVVRVHALCMSALVEATTDEQVRFVVGHELGHHAAGHLNPWKNFLRFPAHFIPFLYPAYSRAREYTCDRIGSYVSQDVSISQSSLQMLGCGCARLNGAMNCTAFTDQEEMVPPIAGFFSEIFRSHPRLTRRIAAIATESAAHVSSSGAVDSSIGLQEAAGAPST